MNAMVDPIPAWDELMGMASESNILRVLIQCIAALSTDPHNKGKTTEEIYNEQAGIALEIAWRQGRGE